MAGPGDEIAAGKAGRGHLRASHADREQVIGTLKAAFVAGMLAKDEFDLRVGQTLVARTGAELTALTADLPAGPTAAMPSQPARRWPGKKEVKAAACGAAAGVAIVITLLTVGAAQDPGTGLSPQAWGLLIGLFTLFFAPLPVVLLLAWLGKLAGRRSSRGLPPGAGGEASQRPAPAGPAGQLPPIDHDPRHTAQAAPVRRTRAPLPSW